MKNRKTFIFLLVALCMVLISGLTSNMLQTNFGKVDVIEIRADLGSGDQFSAIMYKPKTATPATPAPVVIASHGYLNNREMQDIPLVELSRRGIIVISMDRTGHGHSEVSSAAAAGMIQAVEYASKLSFVDNSKIGVTGHSMGGMSTTQTLSYYAGLERTAMLAVAVDALNMGLVGEAIPTNTPTQQLYTQLKALNNDTIDEKIAAAKELNKIHSALTVAANPLTSANSMGVDTITGVIAGKYDEFFFKQAGKYTHYNANLTTPDISADISNNSLYEWNPRDYLSSPGAASYIMTTFAGLPTVSRNTVPTEGQEGYDENLLDATRPNPTILLPEDPIEEGAFYTATGIKEFSYDNPIDERAVVIYTPNEIHPWNHFSTVSASQTIEFFYAAFGLVSGYSYISPANQTWLVKEVANFIGLIGFFFAILPLAALLIKLPFFAKAKKEPSEDLPAMKKVYQYIIFFGVGIALSIACGFLIRPLTGSNFLGTRLFRNDQYFPQPTTNPVSLWAAGCGILALIVFIVQYFIYGRRHGQTFSHWGLKLDLNNIVKMLMMSIMIIFSAYLLLWFVDFFFKTDFRIWSFAIRSFDAIKIDTAVRYMSVFGIYFFANSLVINGANRVKGMPEWVNIAISAFFNVFGIAIVFYIQYSTFFSTGALWQWDMNLTYIVLFPIIPVLIIAAIFSRKLYRITGTIWAPVFVNTILFTLITVANTSTNYNYILFR